MKELQFLVVLDKDKISNLFLDLPVANSCDALSCQECSSHLTGSNKNKQNENLVCVKNLTQKIYAKIKKTESSVIQRPRRPQSMHQTVIIVNVKIKFSHDASFFVLILQHFEALNTSAMMGIQRASSELQTQHPVELQVLVSKVYILKYHPHMLKF